MIVSRWKVQGLYKADAQKVADEILTLGDSVEPSAVVEKAKELFGTLRLTWEKFYPNLQRIWAVVKKTWTQVVKPLIKGFTEGFMKGLIGDEQKNLPEVVL